jgi:hypothetical protein
MLPMPKPAIQAAAPTAAAAPIGSDVGHGIAAREVVPTPPSLLPVPPSAAAAESLGGSPVPMPPPGDGIVREANLPAREPSGPFSTWRDTVAPTFPRPPAPPPPSAAPSPPKSPLVLRKDTRPPPAKPAGDGNAAAAGSQPLAGPRARPPKEDASAQDPVKTANRDAAPAAAPAAPVQEVAPSPRYYGTWGLKQGKAGYTPSPDTDQ